MDISVNLNFVFDNHFIFLVSAGGTGVIKQALRQAFRVKPDIMQSGA